MMLVAVPTLLLMGAAVAIRLPYVVVSPGHDDGSGVVVWSGAVAVGALALLASAILRRRGKLAAAIGVASLVTLPALLGLAMALVVVGMLMLKS
jgi:hypothetical protein